MRWKKGAERKKKKANRNMKIANDGNQRKQKCQNTFSIR